MPIERTKAKGHNKVDLFLDVNHQGFGLLQVKQFGGVKIDQALSDAVGKVLEEFFFPVLNFTFSASGKLQRKDHNDLTVDTWLEELELRISFAPVPKEGSEIDDSALKVIGLLPSETKSTEENSPIQIAPDVGNILTAIPTLAGLSGIVAGLGVTIAPLFKTQPRVQEKAFIANIREFGWYYRSSEDVSQEGVHYTAAVLQVGKNVEAVNTTMTITSDWVKGDVNNQEAKLEKTIKLHHPQVPDTMRSIFEKSASDLPIVLEEGEVKHILGIEQTDLEDLIRTGDLVAFGKKENNRRITKGSLLKVLGLADQEMAE